MDPAHLGNCSHLWEQRNMLGAKPPDASMLAK